MLDPYRTLQVRHDATTEEIKIAYRRLVKQLHPDLHPDDPAAARRFNDVTGAYDLLSDQAKRREYDQGIGAGNRNRHAADENFDIFKRAWSFRNARANKNNSDAHGSAAFGSKEKPSGSDSPRRSEDLNQTIEVSFLEATLGCRKRVSLGIRTLEITIPPLTDDGKTLRLKGQGAAAARNASAGDMLILVKIAPHPIFTRRDLDIHMTLPVSVSEAVLGGNVNVPTLFGTVQVKIPSGSNTDSVLRLRGKGLRAPGGAIQGDQLVLLKVILPDSREPDFIDLIEKWSKTHRYAARPASWEASKP